MANYYTEIPELKFHLNNAMMERICELKERNYQDKTKLTKPRKNFSHRWNP